MIPTLLLAGLAIGVLPRWWPLISVLVAGTAWTLHFAQDDLLTGPLDAAFVFVWGVLNLAAGAFITWLIKRLVATTTRG